MRMRKRAMTRPLSPACASCKDVAVGVAVAERGRARGGWQGNQLTALRGRGLEQLARLRWLSVSHNLLSDPWELTPLLALPAITWLAIAPQRVPRDPLVSAGGAGGAGGWYRRLVVLMTVHSKGSQQQAGLNFLDRRTGARAAALDAAASASGWSAVSIDARLEALEELYLHHAAQQPAACGLPALPAARRHTSTSSASSTTTSQQAALDGRHVVHEPWAGADEAWMAVRRHVLDRLARSASWQIACYQAQPAAGTSTGASSPSQVSLAPPPAERASTPPGGHELGVLAQGQQQGGGCGECVRVWLEHERQRACLFARVGQRVALDARQLGALRELSLAGCGLAHVRLEGLPALVALDLSSNAVLRRIQGLGALEHLETALLERNAGLCSVEALEDLMPQLMALRRLHTVTLPFHLVERPTDALLGTRYDDWQHLTVGRPACALAGVRLGGRARACCCVTWGVGGSCAGAPRCSWRTCGSWQVDDGGCVVQERLMLGVVGSNPVRYLNGRQVCIADRLRAFQHMHMHYKMATGSRDPPLAPSGVQMDWRGADVDQLEQYLTDLVLITSVGKHCICSSSPPSARRPCPAGPGQTRAGDAARDRQAEASRGEVCQHRAGSYVMAVDIVPGLHYDAACAVELPDIHGFGLTAAALCRALPLFCNLRRLNLARNRLVTVCGLGLHALPHLQVLDVSSNVVRDRIPDLGATFDALPRLVALMVRNNPCMRTRAERMRLMQAMTSLGHVSCSLRYLDTAISLAERVQAWAQASARSPAQLETLKQQALINLCTPPGLPSTRLEELDLSARGLRALQGALLAPLHALRRLLLADNALSSLAAAQLERLTTLEVLDLRRNALTDAGDLRRVVLALSSLQELGIGGNPWRLTPPARHAPAPGSAAGGDASSWPAAAADAAASAQGAGARGADGNAAAYEGSGEEEGAGAGGGVGASMRGELLGWLAGRYAEEARYPLRFIDDDEIPIPLIAAAACGEGEGEAAAERRSKLAFELAVARQMQDCVSMGVLAADTRCQELRVLDLSDRELRLVAFAPMQRLTRLLLQHNQLTDEALASGAIRQLSCLQHLDVSFNRIQSCEVVGEIVGAGHASRSLTSLSLSHNPVFPSANMYEHRVNFLASKPVVVSQAAAGATLALLNEARISVEERVDAVGRFLRSPLAGDADAPQRQGAVWAPGTLLCKVRGLRSQAAASLEDRVGAAVQDVRLTLLLEQRRYSFSSQAMSLARLRIGSLDALRDYALVAALDVRGNQLRSLDPLACLHRLRSLDVRDNQVPPPAERL